jgi:hypothetical protein
MNGQDSGFGYTISTIYIGSKKRKQTRRDMNCIEHNVKIMTKKASLFFCRRILCGISILRGTII